VKHVPPVVVASRAGSQGLSARCAIAPACGINLGNWAKAVDESESGCKLAVICLTTRNRSLALNDPFFLAALFDAVLGLQLRPRAELRPREPTSVVFLRFVNGRTLVLTRPFQFAAAIALQVSAMA